MKVSIKLALVGLLVLAAFSEAAKKKGKKGKCAIELSKDNKDYLHQVVVTNFDTNSICGGTWISKDIVVTAGHCVVDKKGKKSNAGSIKVVTDIRDSSKGLLGLSFANGKSRSVKEVALPKDFKKISETYYGGDVAVILLANEFTLFGGNDKKDAMEGKYATLPEGKDAPTGEASELGYLTPAVGLFAKSKSTKLFERAITIMDKAECAKDEHMEDAKADVEGGKTICGMENCVEKGNCERMTGGGLICKGDVLCGIQTIHNCDEEEKLPQGYLNVAEYKAWIEEKVGEMSV